jgi:hypothetical protein
MYSKARSAAVLILSPIALPSDRTRPPLGPGYSSGQTVLAHGEPLVLLVFTEHRMILDLLLANPSFRMCRMDDRSSVNARTR